MSFVFLVFFVLFFQYKQLGLYVLVKSDYYLRWKDFLNVLAAIQYNYSSPGYYSLGKFPLTLNAILNYMLNPNFNLDSGQFFSGTIVWTPPLPLSYFKIKNVFVTCLNFLSITKRNFDVLVFFTCRS